jgi:hypothetical protein
MLHLYLCRHWRNPLLVQYASLRHQWPRLHATTPAVEAHPVADPPSNHHVVDHHGMNVYVVNHVDVHAIDRRVVEKVSVVPVAAVVAMPDVSIAIIHAAIEADM